MTTGPEINIGRIQFVDDLNGWCIGIWLMGPCMLYKTTNGGLTWSTTQTRNKFTRWAIFY